MNNTEIEIKVKIDNSQPLLEFLEQNAEFQSENHQIDEYFIPAHRDFLKASPVVEWLRLRNSDGKCSINYKNWHLDENGKSHHCDEHESGINDLDNTKNVFDALNFKSIIMVDKLRKIWTYKDYEISVDSVKDLGDFIEIEYIGKDENVIPAKVTEEMMGFLENLGVGNIKRDFVGYPFLLLHKKDA